MLITGDFNRVSMGNGVLKHNNRNVGYLKGDVNFDYSYEIEDFKVGVPMRLVGSICKELTCSLKAPLAELSPDNIAMALGGLPVVGASGEDQVTVTAGQFTFAPFGDSGLEGVLLSGPDPTGIVVTSDPAGTTYQAGSDYFVIPGQGVIYRVEDGDIPEGADVLITYTRTPFGSDTIALGAQFSLEQKRLDFYHTSPVTGKTVHLVLWKCTVSGKLSWNFAEGSVHINNVEFKGISDDLNHPTNPFGYIEIERYN